MRRHNVSLIWFTNDLRIRDNRALYSAINSDDLVVPIFIWDEQAKLFGEAQKWWLHNSLSSLDMHLQKLGSRLVLRKGPVIEVLQDISKNFNIQQLHFSRHYTPEGLKQTRLVADWCYSNGISHYQHEGFLLFKPEDLAPVNGKFYSVYTPFWKASSRLNVETALAEPKVMPPCPDIDSAPLDSLNLVGGSQSWSSKFNDRWQVGEKAARVRLDSFLDDVIEFYDKTRDFPGQDGTSKLSMHLHFGELSVRDVWRQVKLKSELEQFPRGETGCITFMKELIWREFCAHLLYHNSHIRSQNFRTDFDNFPWTYDREAFLLWSKGKTGYPIIDAGMRQLWATGWMHNRVRMIVASFLTKNLLIHWRYGEEFFWNTLLDADDASNCVNWQWVAGCGPDAAPYFRIFNPGLQSKKFDPKGQYIRLWVPELVNLPDEYIHEPYLHGKAVLESYGVDLGNNYPRPIVDLQFSRNRALEAYQRWKLRP